jgi:hypothetical protein
MPDKPSALICGSNYNYTILDEQMADSIQRWPEHVFQSSCGFLGAIGRRTVGFGMNFI